MRRENDLLMWGRFLSKEKRRRHSRESGKPGKITCNFCLPCLDACSPIGTGDRLRGHDGPEKPGRQKTHKDCRLREKLPFARNIFLPLVLLFAVTLWLDGQRCFVLSAESAAPASMALKPYRIVDGTIPAPLTEQPGDPEQGRRLVLDRERGDCTVCHAMPLPERQFHGAIGPPLDGIGRRATAGTLRLRLVDAKVMNPQTVMPAYYKVDGFHQVLARYRGQPILTAQEIEDVIAYLLTLQ